jgi:hypothetical protein
MKKWFKTADPLWLCRECITTRDNHSGVPDAEVRKIWQHIGHLVLDAIRPVSELLMCSSNLNIR